MGHGDRYRDPLLRRIGAALFECPRSHSSSVTYSVGGKQFVVVASGWGGRMKGFAPELYGAGRGGALIAFALP